MQTRSPNRLAAAIIALATLVVCPPLLLSADILGQVRSFSLKNGLRLLVAERSLSPTVSVFIRYRAGATDERDGKTGTAHLLEHMMFKGTKTIGTRDYSREAPILKRIEATGAAIDRETRKGDGADLAILARLRRQLADLQERHRRLFVPNELDRLYTEQGSVGLNASTGQDLITYRVSIPANRIELWARIEADRMVSPVFREFYTERDVVREERRQRAESDPDGKLLEGFLAAAYSVHPYRRPILGWPADMEYLDPRYMRQFFMRTHVPNNAVIAMAGDIRPTDAFTIVNRYFGSIPAATLPPAPAVAAEPVPAYERRIEVVYAAEPRLIIGYRKPPPPAPVNQIFDIVESLLTRGRTSRLFRTLVEEQGLADRIHAVNGVPGVRYQNQFALFAAPRFPHTCGELEQAIDAEIDRLKHEPVAPRELEKIKNQIRVNFLRGLDSNAGLAGTISYYQALLGDYRYMLNYVDTINRITPDDIMQVVRTYLVRENRTVATLVKKP